MANWKQLTAKQGVKERKTREIASSAKNYGEKNVVD